MAHEVIAFIKGNCKSTMSPEDINQLNEKFEEYKINDFDTYKLHIHFDPLYKIITSTYRIPDQYNFNGRKVEIEKLEKYIPESTIETLSYLEYVGEKIHSCKKQGEGHWDDDLDTASSSDIFKLMSGLNNYMQNNQLDENHETTKDESEKLIIMAELAQKYNLEIRFFDGYFWQ